MVNINPTLGFKEPLGPLFPNGSKTSSLVLSVPPKEAKGSTLPKGSPCQEWVWCVLPINLFNEKIFIFLWFWFFIVAALSFGNLFHWIYQIVFGENKVTYVRKYLKVAGEIHTNFDKKLSRKFAEHYLRSDGIFVLRMVGKNTSAMFMTDLVQLLWKTFKEEHCSMKNGVTEVEETPLMNGNCQMGDMEPPSLKSKL